MTTLAIDPHAVLTLYEQKFPEDETPKLYEEFRTNPPAATFADITPEQLNDPALQLAVKYLSELRRTDSDERLDYIAQAIPEVTDEHLDQLALITYTWLNDEARDRIRTIAQQRAQNRRGASGILSQWIKEEELTRFYQALGETKFPDAIIATCYALCEVEGVAHAAYFIHLDRAFPQVDVSNIEQTPEEIEADLRFVKAE